MKTTHINYLNMALIVISMMVAFQLPFELFLFSYAVLGPLHYLTEMAWLKEKNFFSKSKHDWKILGGLCTLYVLCYLFYEFSLHDATIPYYQSMFGEEEYKEVASFVGNITVHLIAVGFFIALAMVLVKKMLWRIVVGVGVFVISWFLAENMTYTNIFNLFIPTLIHVFLFTGIFMLYGALKGRSKSGVLSFFLLLVVGAICFFTSYVDPSYRASQETLDSYIASNFHYLNSHIFQLFEQHIPTQRELFADAFGVGIQRFIAFAYTYHYLNWFSKTSIIGWHKVSRKWLIFVIVVWILAVCLYAYSYKVGLIALLYLSMLHVFLEFPLNYQSFIGVGQEIGKRIKGRAGPAEEI